MIKCLCLNLRKPKMYFSPVILLFRSRLLLKCCLFLTHLSGNCGTPNVMDQYSKQWSPTDISNVFTSSSRSLFENRSSRFPFTHNNKHKLNEDSEKHFSSLSLPAFSLSTTHPQMLSLTPASSESIRRNTQANYLAEKLCESAFSSVCVCVCSTSLLSSHEGLFTSQPLRGWLRGRGRWTVVTLRQATAADMSRDISCTNRKNREHSCKA